MKMQACTGGCKFIVIYCGGGVFSLEKKIKKALSELAREFSNQYDGTVLTAKEKLRHSAALNNKKRILVICDWQFLGLTKENVLAFFAQLRQVICGVIVITNLPNDIFWELTDMSLILKKGDISSGELSTIISKNF